MDLGYIGARVRRVSPPGAISAPPASVAAILRARPEGPEVLFIHRAERAGDPWSGHMAFPGGRREGAESALETAVRETREEIGIDLQEHELFGPIADVPTHKTGLIVRVFVFALASDVVVTPHEREVAAIHWVSLLPMMRGERNGRYAFFADGMTSPVELPCFVIPGSDRVIWGLTHRMLEIFFEALG